MQINFLISSANCLIPPTHKLVWSSVIIFVNRIASGNRSKVLKKSRFVVARHWIFVQKISSHPICCMYVSLSCGVPAEFIDWTFPDQRTATWLHSGFTEWHVFSTRHCEPVTQVSTWDEECQSVNNRCRYTLRCEVPFQAFHLNTSASSSTLRISRQGYETNTFSSHELMRGLWVNTTKIKAPDVSYFCMQGSNNVGTHCTPWPESHCGPLLGPSLKLTDFQLR